MPLLAALLLHAPALFAQREPAVQKDLRERFGEWADRFPAELPSYTALETVEHTRWDRKGQQSQPVTAAFRYSFRRSPEKGDLVENRTATDDAAGGNPPKANLVPAGRATSAFSHLPYDVFEKLPLIVTRMALRNHERMRYFFAQDETDTPSNFVIVGYRQTGGNGLMEVDGKAVFPYGRAWIDPEDGRLIRIEEEFGNRDTRYTIAIDNLADEKSWLPERITIRLFDKGRLVAQNIHTYSDFRKTQN